MQRSSNAPLSSSMQISGIALVQRQDRRRPWRIPPRWGAGSTRRPPWRASSHLVLEIQLGFSDRTRLPGEWRGNHDDNELRAARQTNPKRAGQQHDRHPVIGTGVEAEHGRWRSGTSPESSRERAPTRSQDVPEASTSTNHESDRCRDRNRPLRTTRRDRGRSCKAFKKSRAARQRPHIRPRE